MLVSLDRDYLQKNFKEIIRGKDFIDYIKHPLELLQIISELGEQGTRIGEAKRALARAANPIDAAFASREVTLDFSRIGAKTKAINAIIAFWNANVQGMDKMVRSFKEKPLRTMVKTLVGITLPSILLYYANRKDKRWKEIPQWQKNLFWIVMTDKHIYRIPKPFELGILFGSVPERILEYIDNKDSNVFNSLEQSILNGATPGFIPTALSPIIENTTNYSFFRNRKIVPEGKIDLPSEAQYTQYTSEFSKIMGQLIKYSPAKIDNLIQGYFAGLGNYAISAADLILEGKGNSIKPARGLEDYPILKAFMIREPIGSGSESVNRFYDKFDEANSSKVFYNDLEKQGKKEEARQYLSDHPEIKTARYYGEIRQDLSNINKKIQRIYNDKNLSADDKKQRIDQLNKLITDIAHRAIEIKIR